MSALLGIGARAQAQRGFNPASLFANSEPGLLAIFSPSDVGTRFFTDTAGTTPAEIGDPVALTLEGSGNGNHPTQATLEYRPILTRWPKTGRRNLLVNTVQLSGTGWGSNINVSTEETTEVSPPIPGVKVTKLTSTTDTDASCISTAALDLVDTGCSVYIHAGTWDFIALTNRRTDGGGLILDTTTGTVHSTNSAYDPVVFENIGGGWFRIGISRELSSAARQFVVQFAASATNANAAGAANGQHFYVALPQAELGLDITAAQTVIDQYDITEAGQRDCIGLWYDGVDDQMSTVTSDFMSGTEATGAQGVKRFSAGGDVFTYRNAGGTGLGDFTYRVFNAEHRVYSGALDTSTPLAIGDISSPTVISQQVSGTDHQTYRNGSLVATRSTGTALNFDTQNAGQKVYIGSNGNSNFAHMIFFGGFFINRKISAADLDRVERAIARNTPEVSL